MTLYTIRDLMSRGNIIMRDFKELEARIKEIFNVKKNTEIAELLGVSSSVYGNWKARNTIPYDEIISLCEKNNIDMRYIITGTYSEEQKKEKNYKKELMETIEKLNNEEIEYYYHLIKVQTMKKSNN